MHAIHLSVQCDVATKCNVVNLKRVFFFGFSFRHEIRTGEEASKGMIHMHKLELAKEKPEGGSYGVSNKLEIGKACVLCDLENMDQGH